jgi:hypothetical protein
VDKIDYGKNMSEEDRKLFMENLSPGDCGTCKFWDAFGPPAYLCKEKHEIQLDFAKRSGETLSRIELLLAGNYGGECRRYPPSFVVLNDCEHSMNPTTEHYEWCGEYAECDPDE